MFTIIIGLIIGATLAFVGLRLLAYWNDRPLSDMNVNWRHRRR